MNIQRDIEGFSDRDLLVEVYTVVRELKGDFDKLHEQIHGNGQPGIKDRLAKVEERTSPARVGAATGTLGAIFIAIITKILEKMT